MSDAPRIPGAAGRGYEQSDARPSALFAWLLALAATVAGVVWIAGTLFARLEQRAERRDGGGPARGPAALAPAPPPAPRLQSDPAGELAEHRALEARRTEEYAWIDRPAGIVRVPVERAMELLLERGLPVAGERRR